MKISKVVLVVAALHVLVIGGIFVFEGCSRSQSNTPDMAADEGRPGEKPADTAGLTPSSTNPATSEMAPPVSPSTATAVSTAPVAKTYVVKKGDSLWKIARGQNVTVAALKQANNLTSDSLKVDQKLHIPAATATTTASANNGGSTPTVNAGIATASYSDWHEPGTATENGQTIHYVDFGESPALIAKKYGVKVEDLMKLNNITDAKRIVVGQKLIIPAAPAATSASSGTTPATPAVAAPIVSAKQASIGD